MAKSPLLDSVNNYALEDKARFHTPSHKGRADCLPFNSDFLKYDVTELPQTGSLFDGVGPTSEAERLATDFFGTRATLFSAGGCSLCIQTMFGLVSGRGKKVICARQVHRSAVNAMALLGPEPVWVWNRPEMNSTLPGRVSAEDVETLLKTERDIAAIYLTSPDYYGVMSDIEAIARVAKKYGVPLLVDNAHGAHLRYVGEKLHPLLLGATMTADSAHKTLPVLTGGAWLHINAAEYVPYARQTAALFASTSPSYPVMMSLDACRVWPEREGKNKFAELLTCVENIKKTAIEYGYALPQGQCDPVRITINTAVRGYSGEDAADYFRQCGVEPEYADPNWVVFIASPFNREQDFLRLKKAIISLPPKTPLTVREEAPFELPEKACTLREAVLGRCEIVEISKAAGRISSQAVCPCPPGVPVVMPGERISRHNVQRLERYGITHIQVLKQHNYIF